MKTLTATPRDTQTSPAYLRTQGNIPAVLYKKGIENILVSVKENQVRSLYKDIKNKESFTLELEKETYTVVLQDMDVHVVSGEIQHIDFLVV